MPQQRVYLDNNATTPLDARVFEAMAPFFLESFGNPSSLHYEGRRARTALEEARRDIARLIGASTGEIVLTGGGTEADNLAILGAARAQSDRGDHIVTSSIEHPAVLEACRNIKDEGFRVSYLPVGPDGIVLLDELERLLDQRTSLVSVMHANNETGVLQPIAEISRMTRAQGALLHSDAVQAVGKIPVDVKELGVDLLSLTGHKFHGPMGVGALFVRRGIKVAPLALGGGHERGCRAGTENVPGAVGLGRACRLALQELAPYSKRMASLRDRLEQGILQAVPDVVVNGSVERRTPHTTSMSFLGAQADSIMMALDLEGVSVSTGAACHAGEIHASHVLTAMKLERKRLAGAVRFSLSKMTTEEEIDHVLDILPAVVEGSRH